MSPINEIAHEDVVGYWNLAACVQQLQQVEKLTVNISADLFVSERERGRGSQSANSGLEQCISLIMDR